MSKKDDKFKKSNQRKFAVRYYNKELYDFDYIKKLNPSEKIYLQNFFNEEYCNQRLKGSNSVYYSQEALDLLKSDPEKNEVFLEEYKQYKKENPGKRITQLDFFVIYSQRESGRNFYRKQVDVLINRRIDNSEFTLNFDDWIEYYNDNANPDAMDEQAFFLDCYKNAELYRWITIKLINIIDEIRPAHFTDIIKNIKSVYLLHHEKIRASEKASITKSSLYRYLYQIFAYYKVNMPDHEDVKKIVAVFDNCIYNKTKKVMNDLLAE